MHVYPRKVLLSPCQSCEEYQEYLRLKFKSLAQSQSIESQSPWIIYLSSFNHNYGNTSLIFSLSYPKIPYLITLDNGSKVVSLGIGQVSLSPSLNIKFVFFVTLRPCNHISLRQLTEALNCSIIFGANSFYLGL